jgi:hypothetical protein
VNRLTIDEFLERFDPQVQETARAAAAVVRETVPDVIERVYPGWNLIGFRCRAGRGSKYFCFVAPMEDHVRLGFEYGVALEDPHGVLEGDGAQVRYVRLDDARAVTAALRSLIREAAAVARLPREEILEAVRSRT